MPTSSVLRVMQHQWAGLTPNKWSAFTERAFAERQLVTSVPLQESAQETKGRTPVYLRHSWVVGESCIHRERIVLDHHGIPSHADHVVHLFQRNPVPVRGQQQKNRSPGPRFGSRHVALQQVNALRVTSRGNNTSDTHDVRPLPRLRHL